MDMRSGGSAKLAWQFVYIEADEPTAVRVFERLFDRDPRNTTCECCGPDYSFEDRGGDTLQEASAYERGCIWEGGNDGGYVERGTDDRFVPIETFLQTGLTRYGEKTRIVTADEIAALGTSADLGVADHERDGRSDPPEAP